MNKLSPKQLAEIEKSRDEFVNRLRISAWNVSDHRVNSTNQINQLSSDWQFRLGLLTSFVQALSTRQVFNRAKLNREN